MASIDRNIIAGTFSATCHQRVLCATGAKLQKFQAIPSRFIATKKAQN
jgi:hypothetical protein